MDTPNTDTPMTPADSLSDDIQRPESTLPSSPVPGAGDQEAKPTIEAEAGNADLMEDMEGMDTKAKALMHLLKTSSVRSLPCMLP